MRTICYFSGWFEVADTTLVRNLETDIISQLNEELERNPTLTSVILESFEDASKIATDGDFEELNLVVEED